MNLLARFAHTLKAAPGARALPPVLRVDRAAPQWPLAQDDYSDHYLYSTWVHMAVSRISEAAALIPFNVYRLDGEAKLSERNHPIERLLRRPNPVHSGFDLIEMTLGFLELSGNAYWYLAAGADGTPVELWPLRPDRVRIVPDPVRFVGGYVYTLDGTDIPLAPEQVIHFKRWNPRDDFYGLSTLSAAAAASRTDRAMQRWNLNFFSRQSAIPAGMVTIRNMIGNTEFDRVQREWLDSFGSGERRTAFVRGAGEVTWSDIGLNQMESDFLNGRRFNRDEILHLFGIPTALYEKDATRANAVAARQTFLEQTIYPKLVRIAQKLTQDLAPFFGPNLVIEPEPIRDRDAELRELAAARAYLTVNEVRARYFGLGAVAEGKRLTLEKQKTGRAR